MTKVKKGGFRKIVQYHCTLVEIFEITIFSFGYLREEASLPFSLTKRVIFLCIRGQVKSRLGPRRKETNDNKHQGGKYETGVVGAASSGSLSSR